MSKKLISVRLDQWTIDKLKRIADKKGIGYQVLLRIIINDHLEKQGDKNEAV